MHPFDAELRFRAILDADNRLPSVDRLRTVFQRDLNTRLSDYASTINGRWVEHSQRLAAIRELDTLTQQAGVELPSVAWRRIGKFSGIAVDERSIRRLVFD